MIEQHIEKICEHCWKPMVAKAATQKYHIKCWNIVYRENAKKYNKKMSEERKSRREKIYLKIK